MSELAGAAELARGVVARDRRSLSRAITLLESERREDRASAEQLLDALLPHSGGSLRVGFSGPPGAGKSTLIDAYGSWAIAAGKRVAVLAVDPSSQRSGGSILGDKTRMARLAASEHSFIRPSPSRGEPGGLAPRTREAVLACEAAGYDLVLIETVGVGQAEVEVADLVDALLVLLASGTGDELQGMKRGLLEHGDVFAIGKADGDGRERAERAARELASALTLLTSSHPPVLTVSAFEPERVAALGAAIEEFVAQARQSGGFEARRRAQARAWFERAVERGLWRRLHEDAELAELQAELAERTASGELSPRQAAARLLDLIEQRLALRR